MKNILLGALPQATFNQKGNPQDDLNADVSIFGAVAHSNIEQKSFSTNNHDVKEMMFAEVSMLYCSVQFVKTLSNYASNTNALHWYLFLYSRMISLMPSAILLEATLMVPPGI